MVLDRIACTRSIQQELAPHTKLRSLEAPRLARVARWWVAGSGRNLSAGPVATAYALFLHVQVSLRDARQETRVAKARLSLASGSTERQRSRTCLASGYDAVLVLKTSWGTVPSRSVAD